MPDSDLKGSTVGEILTALVTSPFTHLIRRWNWKSAVLSSIMRALLFFTANLSAGFDAARAAFVTELVFRGLTPGFYGAITQAFRTATPPWTGTLAASLLLSVTFTAISTCFNLFAMRSGALIAGAGSDSLWNDLRRTPQLVVNAYHASSGGIRGLYDALRHAAGVHNWQFRLVIPGEETRVDDLDPFARVYRIQAPRAASAIQAENDVRRVSGIFRSHRGPSAAGGGRRARLPSGAPVGPLFRMTLSGEYSGTI